MPIELSFILGLIQALTEFLPVSSSGHLAVAHIYLDRLFDADSGSLAFDVLLHLATLLVTVHYLRKDIWIVLRELFSFEDAGRMVRYLVLLVIVASLPIGIVGLGFKDRIELLFSSPLAVALGFLTTTAFLLGAHIAQRRSTYIAPDHIGSDILWELPKLHQAAIIGLAQMVAILPGISRSGSTIATALMLGLPVRSAVRFSFLISIPAILGAGLLQAKALSSIASAAMPSYAVGFLTAIVAGWFAIRLLVKATEGVRLIYFAMYTFVLAILLFVAMFTST